MEHVPAACAGCGAGLAQAQPDGMVRRQVHDIPPITARVIEHRLARLRCAWGHRTRAQAPAGVSAPARYGPNLRALAAYLVVYQHVPVARAAQLIADVTGARPSTGWITSVLAPTAASVSPTNAAILDLLRAADVLHVDETSSNITGIRWWVHVATTPLLTASSPAPLPRPGRGHRVRGAARLPRHPGPRQPDPLRRL
ncbi:IS66 family transposase [Pseudonocardia sp. GCM10023141]|uniref:IS66 family transposase n=1 Tax=Pseudonocardia sp. GCM10023141 TaxID=3252653 RepID=UPI0036127205